jgi:hypothetical protein
MLWNAGNWIMMAAVMVGVSFQVRTIIPSVIVARSCLITSLSNLLVGFLGTCLTRTFEAMLKDRMIIAAEVLHKYDEKVQSYFPLLSRTTH